jgi:hypothetical protein
MPPFTKTILPLHDPFKPQQRAPQQGQQQRQQKMKQEKKLPEQAERKQQPSFSSASLQQHQPAGVRAQLVPRPQQLPISSPAHMPARQPIAQQKYESAAPPSGYNSSWPGNAASSFVSASDATARPLPAPQLTILQQQSLPPTHLAHAPATRRRKPQPPKQQETTTTSADQTTAAQAAAQQEEQMIKQLGQQVQELALSSSRDAGQAQKQHESLRARASGQILRFTGSTLLFSFDGASDDQPPRRPTWHRGRRLQRRFCVNSKRSKSRRTSSSKVRPAWIIREAHSAG